MTKRVLIGYDGSTYADDAIDDLRRAGLPHRPIELAQAQGLKVLAEIRKGDPATILMTEADEWKADAIFVGAPGYSSTAYDSNSVSMQLATNASCSIEIVRNT
jgi:nucleotide-binding universal stress UspA family protein